MTHRCIDFETTGLPSEDEPSGIMEMGACDLKFGIIHPPESTLVNCGIPVTVGAQAIHHISDKMVLGAVTPDRACMLLMTGMSEGDCFVAHNIDHEKHYFSGGEFPFLCTYKTALRIWPDAPGHKLMELRYWLKLDDRDDFDPKMAEPPHRAGPDAYVCAHLLRTLLLHATVEQMVLWSSGPALLSVCFLKKHKGTLWSEVAKIDRSYVEWAANNVDDRDIRATAKYWLKQTA